MKMKEFGPRRAGGSASLAPPLDPAMVNEVRLNFWITNLSINAATEPNYLIISIH